MDRLSQFRFLNSSVRILYGAFMLQFSFVLPLSVAIASDERQYSTFLEGYLVFLNSAAIPALIALHYVLWRINRISLFRWIYDKLLRACCARKRPKQSASQDQSKPDGQEQGAAVINVAPNTQPSDDESLLKTGNKPEAENDRNDGAACTDSAAVAEEDGTKDGTSNTQVHKVDDVNIVEQETKQTDHLGEPITAPDIMMRIGAFGFGFAGMILNILRISDRWTDPLYYEHCRTSLSNAMYLCHILFYLVQTYFLFKHQGHRLPKSNRIIRFLLLHLVVTNVALWINAVVVEVTEDLHEKTYEYLRTDLTRRNESFTKVVERLEAGETNFSNVLSTESNATRKQFLLYFCHSRELPSLSAATYLFPLMVEYFIISASILAKIYLTSYTMAENPKANHKNSKNRDQSKHKSRTDKKPKEPCRDGDETNNATEEVEMCDAESEGEDEEGCLSCKKSYRGLIAGIILLLIAISSIIAFLVVLARKKVDEEEVREIQEEPNQSESESAILTTQIETSTESAKRFEEKEVDSKEQKVKEAEQSVENDTILALLIYQSAELVLVIPPLIACILLFLKFRAHFVFRRSHRSERIDAQQLFIGFIGVLTYNTFITIASFERSSQEYTLQKVTWVIKTILAAVQAMLQIGVIMRGFRSKLPPGNAQLMEQKPGRSLVTFLILANLSLWFTNTFQMKYLDQVPDLYHTQANITPWSIITHLLIPFSIFYRFHSTISFLHIWHVNFEEHHEEEVAPLTHVKSGEHADAANSAVCVDKKED